MIFCFCLFVSWKKKTRKTNARMSCTFVGSNYQLCEGISVVCRLLMFLLKMES